MPGVQGWHGFRVHVAWVLGFAKGSGARGLACGDVQGLGCRV